jgi:hypothetical protein
MESNEADMKKTLAILVVSPVLCSAAIGGTLQQRVSDTPYADGSQVKASGDDLKFGTARGMGQDMPLYKALTAIVPRGYSVRTVGVERWLLDEPVNWIGGREWTQVLADAISNYPELVVDIATGSKVVIVRQVHSSFDGNAAQYASASTEQVTHPPVEKTAKAAPVEKLARAEPKPEAKAETKPDTKAETKAETKPNAPKIELAAYTGPAMPFAQPKADPGPYMDMPRPAHKYDIAYPAKLPNAAPTVEKAAYVVKDDAKTVTEAAAKTKEAPAAEKAPKASVTVAEKSKTEPESYFDALNAQQKQTVAALMGEPAAPAATAPATVAAKPAPAPAPAPAPTPTWEVRLVDKTVKSAFERWGSTAGWQVSWEMTVDYPVDAHASVSGSFEEAVVAVVKSMERAEIPMKAIFYSGNKVLRIVAKGVE